MLKEKELLTLLNSLPDDGLDQVAKQTGYHKDSVRRVLKSQSKYNAVVVDVALEVAESHKELMLQKADAQKKRIKELKA